MQGSGCSSEKWNHCSGIGPKKGCRPWGTDFLIFKSPTFYRMLDCVVLRQPCRVVQFPGDLFGSQNHRTHFNIYQQASIDYYFPMFPEPAGLIELETPQ
jgi:hypothetical protein